MCCLTRAWSEFFKEFPDYRNTFVRVQSCEDLVAVLGYAEWTLGSERDYVIWTATIRDDLVAEWRVLKDTDANRKLLGLM